MMMKKMRMNKKLILGLALAMVLVSGAFIGANAAQCSSCLPHVSLPACFGHCSTAVTHPPMNATCQGAYNYGPATPNPMGTVGIGGG